MSAPRISYYAHHLGSGHLRHARRLAATGLADLQVASTGTKHRELFPDDVDYVPLEPDDINEGLGFPPDHGYLHYAPTGPAITARFASLSRAWSRFKPDLVMVDVSVEVALFARLSGYRVALRRMPGHRTDPAHRMAYDLAEVLFAYYPEALEDPEHHQRYAEKSFYLGTPDPAASREQSHRGQEEPGAVARKPGRRVAVQTSLASSVDLSLIGQAAAASPQWQWDVLGSIHGNPHGLPDNITVHGIVAQPERWMKSADVVISSSGHNAVAAAASTRRPALLIPEERPFGEQHAFARMLHHDAGCAVLDSWNAAGDWSHLLEQTATRDGSALARSLLVPEEVFAGNVKRLIERCLGN